MIISHVMHVLQENYVMDLSVNSSTLVRIYNIADALNSCDPCASSSGAMYRGSLQRGGYNNLTSEYSVIQAVKLTLENVILASDGSGFNTFTW